MLFVIKCHMLSVIICHMLFVIICRTLMAKKTKETQIKRYILWNHLTSLYIKHISRIVQK